MKELYIIFSGIGVWIAFSIFFGGLILKIIFLCGISQERDKLIYHHFSKNISWPLRSIFYWLIPLGSFAFRLQPLFAIIYFIFHACLLIVPVFLLAHSSLLEENFGFKIPFITETITNWLTLVVIICILFLLLRRLIRPEVRSISDKKDFLLLMLVLGPFISGYFAYNQWGNYEFWMVLHLISSELMLILIPFTKLAHLIFFFFSRGFIGQEMGTRREINNRIGSRTW